MTSLREWLTSGRALRDRVALWRLRYFVDIWRLRQFAAVLLMRCGSGMSLAPPSRAGAFPGGR